MEWCSNCDPTLHIFFKYLQKENNIIQKRSYDLEDSAAAHDVKHAQLHMMLNMANLNQKSKIHEEVLTSLCREMKHFTSNPPMEWVMRLIFFPPEDVYTDSSFLENLSSVSESLKKRVVSTRKR